MNAVDGCYKTWKYTAAHLAVLHSGFGNAGPVDWLLFEAAEEAFSHSIVETITNTDHVPIKPCISRSRRYSLLAYWVDSTGCRNTFDHGGVYGATSRMDAKVDGEMDDALARCAVTSR